MNQKTMNIPIKALLDVRKKTEQICSPLETEDYVLQPVVDVSPPKWHLGHTTWFFEQFILVPFVSDYQVFDEDFSYVFNSYYENVGKRVIRTNRGNLSRPTVKEIYNYRSYVTHKLEEQLPIIYNDEIAELLAIGMNHEQQHQELLITDIKYILGHNPLFPIYDDFNEGQPQLTPPDWISKKEGIYEIGYNGDNFHFDNEKGKHKVYLHDFSISDSLVTNGEYLEFIEDGGYSNFNLWHSEGWDFVSNLETKAPMYWHKINGHCHR
jgi:ergothioneine biosynthesis protein EgtB